MTARIAALGLVAALVVAGCGVKPLMKGVGEAGKNPGRINCKGTANIEESSELRAGQKLEASATYRLNAECGDGFEYEQGPPK